MIKNIIRKITIRKKAKKKCSIIRGWNISEDLIIGQGCIVGKRTHISSGVSIGNCTYLNGNQLDVIIESNTEIGNFCSIGPGVIIGMGNHYVNKVTTHPLLFNSYYKNILKLQNAKLKLDGLEDKDNKTVIGNDVWIGARANIKRGVKIGNGAIIGAECMVTHDVPDYAVVVGVPSKIIKYRFNEEQITFLKKNERYCFWNWDNNQIDKYFGSLYNVDEYIKCIENMMKTK